MNLQPDLAFTLALPKTELHAHLSGSINKECLHDIWIEKRNQESCLDLEDPLHAIRPGGDFVDILTFFPLFDKYIYNLCNDIKTVAYATWRVLEDFENDGVRYLELRTTPRECKETSMSKEAYVETVNETVRRWNLRRMEEMEVFLILSIDRKMDIEDANSVVDLAIKYHFPARQQLQESCEGFVVAIDLCGNPMRGNVSQFTPAFARAKAHGLGITVHFAEVPQSSTDAELDTLLSWQPARVGHGIHIPTRHKEAVKERKLSIEICLSCNVLSKLTPGGVPQGFSRHHFGEWYGSVCAISLGTDDVGVFGSPLSREYLLVAQSFDLSTIELIRLSREAANSAFTGKERMMRLIDEFQAGLQRSQVISVLDVSDRT